MTGVHTFTSHLALFWLCAVWEKTLRIDSSKGTPLLSGSLDQREGTRGGESGDKILRGLAPAILDRSPTWTLGSDVWINIALWILGWIPGVIHAWYLFLSVVLIRSYDFGSVVSNPGGPVGPL